MGLIGRRARPLRAAPALACVCASAAVPVAVSGQGVVRSAEITVAVSDRGAARVSAAYVLLLDGVVDEVTVELLLPEGVTVGGFTSDAGPFTLSREIGMRSSATLALAGSGAERRLALEYDVEGGAIETDGGVHVRVPVLSVALPPVDGGDVLLASVRVPESWAVYERFPTGLRASTPGLYRLSLPAVPSVITVRARTDGSWRPGLGLILELATALVLVAFGWLSWRGSKGLRT